MQKKLVVFDFDGVIVNTHGVSLKLNQATNPHLTEELYSQMSHGNFYASFESDSPLLKFTQNPNFGEEYRKQILGLAAPRGIAEAIKYCADTYIVTIVSSAWADTIKDFLDKEELLPYFQDILGADTHKSKVVKLNILLEKYAVKPENAVFITDTLGDILEAHEVNIKSIGVTWGLHNTETLMRGKPEIIIDDPTLLLQTIEKILN